MTNCKCCKIRKKSHFTRGKRSTLMYSTDFVFNDKFYVIKCNFCPVIPLQELFVCSFCKLNNLLEYVSYYCALWRRIWKSKPWIQASVVVHVYFCPILAWQKSNHKIILIWTKLKLKLLYSICMKWKIILLPFQRAVKLKPTPLINEVNSIWIKLVFWLQTKHCTSFLQIFWANFVRSLMFGIT